VNIIRWLLGRVILLGELLFSPRPPRRSAEAQAAVDRQSHGLALYQFQACPFCVKVRFTMKRLGLNIETRDARRVPSYREELLGGGGQIKVPCLRIQETDGQVRWLYESSLINSYLEQRFAVTA
jgi:glutaredoxin